MKTLNYIVLLIISLTIYYISFSAIFFCNSKVKLLVSSVVTAIFGILTFLIGVKLSLLFKNLNSIIYSKLIFEFFAILRKFTGWDDTNLNIFIALICLLNIIRSISKNIFITSFDYEKKTQFFKDTIILENHFYKLFTGKELTNCIINIKNSEKYNSKTLFAALCDCDKLNQQTGRFWEISSNINEMSLYDFSTDAKITKKSLSKYFSRADEVLRILTQGFEDDLNFQDFHESIRQFNFERSNYVNFVDESLNVISIIIGIHWVFYNAILLAIAVQLFANDGILKMVIYPFVLFLFPLIFNTVKPFLFLIYMHPFDIGDRVFISDFNEENLIVKSIGLNSTIFERWNNEIVIYTNNYLQSKVLKNIKRSRKQTWLLDIMINKSDLDKVKELELFLTDFCNENTALEGIVLSSQSIKDSSYIKINIQVKHSINHQNGYFMWFVQNKFMKRFIFYLNLLKIKIDLAEQPISVKHARVSI